MLDFNQFKQLKTLNDLKSYQATKFIVLPEDLKAKISYKTLLSEATWSDLGSSVNVMHVLKDLDYYFGYSNESDMIDLEEIHNLVMIDYAEDEREEFIMTFENLKALNEFTKSEWQINCNAVYLELNDQMIEELAAKTREAQIESYDQKIAKAKLDIKFATAALKEYEDAKGELMNESK